MFAEIILIYWKSRESDYTQLLVKFGMVLMEAITTKMVGQVRSSELSLNIQFLNIILLLSIIFSNIHSVLTHTYFFLYLVRLAHISNLSAYLCMSNSSGLILT